jgi:hypothetical protein
MPTTTTEQCQLTSPSPYGAEARAYAERLAEGDDFTREECIDWLRMLFEAAGEPTPEFEAVLWKAYCHDWLGAEGEAGVLESCLRRGWIYVRDPLPTGETVWNAATQHMDVAWTTPRAFEHVNVVRAWLEAWDAEQPR